MSKADDRGSGQFYTRFCTIRAWNFFFNLKCFYFLVPKTTFALSNQSQMERGEGGVQGDSEGGSLVLLADVQGTETRRWWAGHRARTRGLQSLCGVFLASHLGRVVQPERESAQNPLCSAPSCLPAGWHQGALGNPLSAPPRPPQGLRLGLLSFQGLSAQRQAPSLDKF